MEDFTKKQIQACKKAIAGIEKLPEIEKGKEKPSLVNLKKLETMLAQQQGILKGLEGTKLN